MYIVIPKVIYTSTVVFSSMPRLQYDRKNRRYNITVPKELVIEHKMEKGDLITFNTNEDKSISLRVIYREKEYTPHKT